MPTIYQALYRKWRPRSFDDVTGQRHITETLKNQVRLGRTSHAYLFVGTRGTGKTTCAKILAKAVNCESPDGGNPCNRCRSCLGIDSGAILDVEELDAASNNGVDNVRALRDEAVYSPAHVKARVYIIDEVHMLSTSAFNALLKILEEPPKHLMFILATTELHKVPPTILSRCQRHSFRRLAASDIAKRLSHVAEEEGISLDGDASELLSRLADGSMRDALSLLDQCSALETVSKGAVLSSLGLIGNLQTAELFAAVASCDAAGALACFGELWRDGKDTAGLLGEISALMRDILITRIAGGSSPLLSGAYAEKTLESFAVSFSDSELLSGISRLQKAMVELRSGSQPRVTAELCLAELCLARVAPCDSADVTRPKAARRGEKPKMPLPPVTEPEVSEPERPNEAEAAMEPERPNEAEAAMEPERPDEAEAAMEPERVEPVINAPAPPPVADEAAESFWSGLLARARDKIQPGNFSFLSEDFHARGGLEGSELIVRAQNEFAMSMVNLPAVLGALEAEAAVMLGRPCKARVILDERSGALNAEKLDNLSKFSNFTIV